MNISRTATVLVIDAAERYDFAPFTYYDEFDDMYVSTGARRAGAR